MCVCVKRCITLRLPPTSPRPRLGHSPAPLPCPLHCLPVCLPQSNGVQNGKTCKQRMKSDYLSHCLTRSSKEFAIVISKTCPSILRIADVVLFGHVCFFSVVPRLARFERENTTHTHTHGASLRRWQMSSVFEIPLSQKCITRAKDGRKTDVQCIMRGLL